MNKTDTLLGSEIMARRARDLARPLEAESVDESAGAQFVSIVLGSETYALSARYVMRASPRPSVVTMPGAQAPMAGVTAYEGEILPVFDLRGLIGMPPRQDAGDGWLLVIGAATAELGLLVDRVSTVAGVDSAELEPGWMDATYSPTDLFAMTTAAGVTVLDVERLLSDDRLFLAPAQPTRREARA